MRRFLFLMLMLMVLLLVGRSVSSAAAAGEFDLEMVRASDLDPDDEWEKDRDSRTSRRGRARTYPRVRDGRVRFRLEDRNYERVWVTGSFNDWEELPMELSESRGLWEAHVDVDRGRHQYLFVVETEDEVRRRRDPSNARRTRNDDRDWVSEILIGKDGRLISRDNEYDADLFEEMQVSYQRVDGLSVAALPQFTSNVPYAPSLNGRFGYGFASERWSGRLQLEQPLVEREELRATLSLYDTTDFTDQTGVGDTENSITSLVVREDNRDYYRREGLAVGLAFEPRRRLRFRAEVRSEDQSSLARAARGGWGGRSVLMLNPAIQEGTMRSLLVKGRAGRDLHHFEASWEYSHDDFISSDFRFSQLTAQYRTRFRMGRDHHLDLRLKGGKNFVGDLPVQKRYVLGGIGTLRGYQYQSVLLAAAAASTAKTEGPLARGGQQMILGNAEYVIGVDHDLQLVLLFDTGLAAEDRNAEMDPSDWKSSVGLGVQFDEDMLRINIVKPLDSGNQDVMVQARLNRMF